MRGLPLHVRVSLGLCLRGTIFFREVALFRPDSNAQSSSVRAVTYTTHVRSSGSQVYV